jgi:hypothetical protein
MTATAYVEETRNFSRVAWSLRAGEVRAPGKPAGRPVSVGRAAS